MGDKRISREQRQSIKSARKFSKQYTDGQKVYTATKRIRDESQYTPVLAQNR